MLSIDTITLSLTDAPVSYPIYWVKEFSQEYLDIHKESADFFGINYTLFKPGESYISNSAEMRVVVEGKTAFRVKFENPEQGSNFFYRRNQLQREMSLKRKL